MTAGKHHIRGEAPAGTTALRRHAEDDPAPRGTSTEVPTTDWFAPSESSMARHAASAVPGPRYATRAPRYTGTRSRYPNTAPAYLDPASRYPDTSPGYLDPASRYPDTAAGHADTESGYLDTSPDYVETESGYPDTGSAYLDAPVTDHPDTAAANYLDTDAPAYRDTSYSGYSQTSTSDYPDTDAPGYLYTAADHLHTSTPDYPDTDAPDYLYTAETGYSGYSDTEAPDQADTSIPSPRRAAAAEQLSDPVDFLSVPVDYLPGPVEDRSAPVDYGSVPVDYLSDPVEDRSAPVDYRSVPEGYLSAPVQDQSAAVDYDYLSIPVDDESAPVDYRSVPEGYLSTPVRDEPAPVDYHSVPEGYLSTPVREQPDPIDYGSVPVELLSVPVERLDSVGCPDETIPAIPRIAAAPAVDPLAAVDLAGPAAAPELDRPAPPPALARPAVHEGDTPSFGPRRLVTASVVLALIGGGLWLGMARPDHVPPVAAPPAAPPPAAPSVITPKPATPKPATPKPPTSLAPRGPIGLAGWKLTLPTASEKGTAASVNPANPSAPYLTRDNNGGLKFWAPVDGTTTPNSKHPRTELVSLKNWKAGNGGKRTLRASLSVAQTPSANQDIIIGQIHGADDISSVPYVMLHYDGGAVRVVVKQQQSGPTSDKYALISGVPLGARFDYTITDQGNGNLTFTATYGSNTRSVTIPISSAFRNATIRFQAGAYQQGESSSGSQDGARLTFYSLNQ
ncbi:MAG TPA: polysaccharide lyase family 7 protein [Pseudonocardia sp.]|uniref:polysaccharide lyase family 7 protein n=1 Tax=Pseudonocardia sp. TaxID=60912 RepID=UPI002C3257A6|nr:polysaccharide lyase family 7 protein [Pseudonocardia sp.]HTF45941.1 polysaccharide lyase family 7 protein [Pseudonocardia sp.]